MAGAEFTLLRRSPFTLVMGAVLPTALGLLILWAEADTGRAGPDATAGLLLVTVITLTGYVSGTTTLAARRRQSVLRRLRTSGASDAAILAGTLAPSAALTVAQTALLLGITASGEGLGPVTPGPLLLAVVGGTVLGCALAALTAAFTSAPELAQLTTSPIALAWLGSALWAARTPPDQVPTLMLALPGAAVTQLSRIAWQIPGAAGLLPAIALLTLPALAAVPIATRLFRWDPRQ
nr:ABC transporter permease [Actinoplanes ianthinogenes]